MIQKLFKPVDNTPIILFRIIFGLLLFLECAGAIVTGWVKKVMVDPQFTFSFVGFEWLQPLPGNGMYFYYSIMAILGLMVMVGMFYRIAISGFAVMWTLTYWMQTTHYNNHYYLLILICLFMAIIPAHTSMSLDVKSKRAMEQSFCPQWCIWIFIFQLWIVFTYAAIAKLYPGWMDGDFISLILGSKRSYPIIGELLQNQWLQKAIVWGGIAFDGFIVYLLFYKRTRIMALALSVVFHLFNSVVFQIGIFPYLMIALCLFFFPGEQLRRIFFKNKVIVHPSDEAQSLLYQKPLVLVLAMYFIIQLALPLRHHFIEGSVLWTSEGHKMSWRMMLLTRNGSVKYRVINAATKEEIPIKLRDHMSPTQANKIGTQPAMIWLFAQRLKRHFQDQGIDEVEIYVDSTVRVNKGDYKTLIDPDVNLAKIKWDHVQHKPWVLLFE